MKNLLSRAMLLAVVTSMLPAECTKTDLMKLIDEGFIKSEIVKACGITDSSTETKIMEKKKWITPKKSDCHAHGGKLKKGTCEANWHNAKKICNASDGRLPMIQELIEVISDCAGNMDDTTSAWTENKKNQNYQTCYQRKGFTSSNIYWSATTYTGRSGAWSVHFYDGFQYYGHKSNRGYIRCIINEE